MICDTLENLERYESAHPRFREAFAFLRRLIAEGAEAGRHDLPGSDGAIFANMNLYETKPLSDATRMEVHRSYIDVQIVLEGEETMCVPSMERELTLVNPYTEEKEYALFRMPAPDSCVRLPLPAGSFAIFFPGEVHACLATGAAAPLKKLVGKVHI